jgi:hypothetical protein
MEDKPSSNLSSEDRSRMRRLTEEVTARYFEMATIMERTSENNSGLRDRAFAPGGKITISALEGELPTKACFCVEVDGGHYIDPPGQSASGPCPDAAVVSR